MELVEYLKDPMNSIKKFPETSQVYLEYNCKILKKAIEFSSTSADYKSLLTKSDELALPQLTPEINISQ